MLYHLKPAVRVGLRRGTRCRVVVGDVPSEVRVLDQNIQVFVRYLAQSEGAIGTLNIYERDDGATVVVEAADEIRDPPEDDDLLDAAPVLDMVPLLTAARDARLLCGVFEKVGFVRCCHAVAGPNGNPVLLASMYRPLTERERSCLPRSIGGVPVEVRVGPCGRVDCAEGT